MKLRAVVLDWAGTIVDFGSRAPVAALESVFAAAGVPVTVAELRESMGLAKKAHIRSILEIPRVREAWALKHGRPPSEAAVDQLYAEFIPSQIRVLANHSQLIPGVAEAIARMRSRGLKLVTPRLQSRHARLFAGAGRGSGLRSGLRGVPGRCTRGPSAAMDVLSDRAPLGSLPARCIRQNRDTPADVEEGRNSGMWTIGVTRTGNEAGITEEEWARSCRRGP